jgi:lipoprotein signal peptidase
VQSLQLILFSEDGRDEKNILTSFYNYPCSLADILTKYWVNISDPEFSVIGNILRITHVKNTGVAFGTPLPGISFVIPLILLGILEFSSGSHGRIFLREKKQAILWLSHWSDSWNALERTFFGSVTDFISVQYFSVFNVADIAITGWVILLFWEFLLERRK